MKRTHCRIHFRIPFRLPVVVSIFQLLWFSPFTNLATTARADEPRITAVADAKTYAGFIATHLEQGAKKPALPAFAGEVLEITENGIGPFRLGMDVDAVIALIGKPRSINTAAGEGAPFVVVRDRASFTFAHGRLVSVALGSADFTQLRLRGHVIGRDLRPDNAVEKLGTDALAGPGGRAVLSLGDKAIFGFNLSRRQAGENADSYYVDLRDMEYFNVTPAKIAASRQRISSLVSAPDNAAVAPTTTTLNAPTTPNTPNTPNAASPTAPDTATR